MPTISPTEILKSGSLGDVKELLKSYRFPDYVIQEESIKKYKEENLGKRALTLHGNKTPLHYAALNGDPEVVDYLLKKLCDIHCNPKEQEEFTKFKLYFLNKTDEEGKTVLHYAALNKNSSMIDHILKQLYDLENILEEEQSQRLLKEKFLNNKVDKEGCNPLMLAVQVGNFSVIKYLIENGADYKAITLYGLDIIGILEHNKHYSIVDKVKDVIRTCSAMPKGVSLNVDEPIVHRKTTSSQQISPEKTEKTSSTSWFSFGFFSTSAKTPNNIKDSDKEITKPLLPKLKTN